MRKYADAGFVIYDVVVEFVRIFFYRCGQPFPLFMAQGTVLTHGLVNPSLNVDQDALVAVPHS